MPTIAGFDAIVAWSGNPVGGLQGDMTCVVAATCATVAPVAGTTTRKGDGWNINPQYTNGPFQIGYDYWRAKPDLISSAGAYSAAAYDQRGDSIYGYYKFGGFKVGLGWNKSRLETAANGTIAGYGAGTKVADRTAWSIPLSYVWGPHNIVGHYTKAGNSSSNITNAVTSSTGARMTAIAYVYDFSKRTSVGVTYATIRNDANANYNFFTGASFGNIDTTPFLGENPRLLQATVRHAF
jgi:predicted porin